jgi:hypothetical protein
MVKNSRNYEEKKNNLRREDLEVKEGVRSAKFIWAQCAQLYAHWLRPRNLTPPPHLGTYKRALLVSQDRRHLFVTPCLEPSICQERHLGECAKSV